MDTTGLSIGLVASISRSITAVKTVSSGAVNRPIPQDEFVVTCKQYQQEAVRHGTNLPKVVAQLWKCEGFATTFGKHQLPENTLSDPLLPREVLGITHVGFGAASTEFVLFNPAKLHEIAQTKCVPDYAGFFIEGVGSILRIYEPGLFKWMCGMLGLISKGTAPGPDQTQFYQSFFSSFLPELQRLITHGYGRLLVISMLRLSTALAEAMRLPSQWRCSAVQGIAFAFGMMNSPEMPRLLENSAIDSPPPIRGAFQNGLVYAVVFADWFAPGLLRSWQSHGRLERELITWARVEAELNLQRGHPLPFALENPR